MYVPLCMSLPQVYKTTNKNAFFVIFCCYVYCYICLAAGIKPSVHQHSFNIFVSFSCLSTIGYICAVRQNNINNNNNNNLPLYLYISCCIYISPVVLIYLRLYIYIYIYISGCTCISPAVFIYLWLYLHMSGMVFVYL